MEADPAAQVIWSSPGSISPVEIAHDMFAWGAAEKIASRKAVGDSLRTGPFIC
jgi:hypothetical protein